MATIRTIADTTAADTPSEISPPVPAPEPPKLPELDTAKLADLDSLVKALQAVVQDREKKYQFQLLKKFLNG